MRLLAVSAALLLAACAPEDAGGDGISSPARSANQLWNTSWVAQTVADKPVVPPGAITLTFSQGRASGTSGCNSYTGGANVKGDAITFSMMASTMMACLEDGKMEQEAAYTELLRKAVRFERPDPSRLSIIAADGRRATFAAKR